MKLITATKPDVKTFGVADNPAAIEVSVIDHSDNPKAILSESTWARQVTRITASGGEDVFVFNTPVDSRERTEKVELDLAYLVEMENADYLKEYLENRKADRSIPDEATLIREDSKAFLAAVVYTWNWFEVTW